MKKLLIVLLFVYSCSAPEGQHIANEDSCYNNVCQRCRYVDGKLDACWPIYSVQSLDLVIEETSEGE
jgi:hypothetical protein